MFIAAHPYLPVKTYIPPPSAAMSLKLYKKEKLCSLTAISQMFGGQGDTHALLRYPLRMVWRYSPGRRSDATVQFLISVPKRRVRHAVDRVRLRRQIREAYRLNHQEFERDPSLRLDVIFFYVGQTPGQNYRRIEQAMRFLLGKLPSAPEKHEMITEK